MIYTALAFLAGLAAAPFIFILSFKKKYRTSLKARFFLYKNPKFSPAAVHFHACSLGEVNALAPLISKFESVALSTTTQTGFNAARSLTPNSRYLPFENWLPFWLTGSRVLVIFEAELWLNLIRSAKSRGSYVILLNARISDRSYASYLRFKFYYRKAFENIDLVLAQSELDAARLRELGAKNIRVAGNIKSANIAVATKDYSAASANSFVLTISNTHEGEEELVLSNLNDFIKFHGSQSVPEKDPYAAGARGNKSLPAAELCDETSSLEPVNLNAASLDGAIPSDASSAVPNTAPLNGAYLKRKFGNYNDPVYNIKLFNENIVLGSNSGDTQVKAVLPGKVVFAKETAVLDKVVILEHSGGIHTIYAHLNQIPPTVRVGSNVKKGYIIGRIGSDLTFEVTQQNYHINPLDLISLR